MAAVKIADILTPEVWRQYGDERTAEKSAFWQSGVFTGIPGLDLPRGGATVNLPYFGDLSGDLETLDDNTALTVNKIGTAKQVAPVVARGKAWGVNDLAPLLAGDDPAAAIIDRLAAYWARQYQKELLNTLTGVFGAASMAGNVQDISALAGPLAVISASTLVDAQFKLGDSFSKLSAMAVHSATYQKLLKDDLIAFIKPSEGTVSVPTYLGKRVIVDDSMPVASTVYTSYLFGAGAIGFAQAAVGNGDTEQDRDILAGEDVLTMRRRWVLHVQGTRWQGTPAADFPSRTELAVGTNWLRVFESKNIPVVQFKHKLA